MARGRKPKPPKLKIVNGNPGGRSLKDNPKSLLGAPPCPRWLSTDARAEWRRVVPQLLEMGVLARTDLAVLVMYCCAWAQHKEACELVAAEGAVYKAKGGLRKKHPAVGIVESSAKQMRLLAGELGLTSLARLRLDVGAEPEADELEDFRREQRG